MSSPGLDGHDHGVRAVALAYRQRILTSHGQVDKLPSLGLQSLLAEHIQCIRCRAMVQPFRGNDHLPRGSDRDAVAIPRAHTVAGEFVPLWVFLDGRPDRIGSH